MCHHGSRSCQQYLGKDSKGLGQTTLMSVLQEISETRFFLVRSNQNPTLHQFALVCDLHARAGRECVQPLSTR